MSSDTASKIFEWCSYILILGATTVFFLLKEMPTLRINLTLIVLVVAVYMRALMYRSRLRGTNDENEELRRDLRRLTAMLSDKEKGNK